LTHMREQHWLRLHSFGNVYALLAACEGRFPDAARLLGWADEVRQLRGERQRNEARCRDEAGCRVAAALDAAQLQSLMAEGVAMEGEVVCQAALALTPTLSREREREREQVRRGEAQAARRRAMPATPSNPAAISAHVPGSGTGLVRLILKNSVGSELASRPPVPG
jgi:hypothetical protein